MLPELKRLGVQPDTLFGPNQLLRTPAGGVTYLYEDAWMKEYEWLVCVRAPWQDTWPVSECRQM